MCCVCYVLCVRTCCVLCAVCEDVLCVRTCCVLCAVCAVVQTSVPPCVYCAMEHIKTGCICSVRWPSGGVGIGSASSPALIARGWGCGERERQEQLRLNRPAFQKSYGAAAEKHGKVQVGG